VPIEDAARVDQHGRPLITGVRLEVREDEAASVRRIFEMYAGENSLQKIAKQLNADGVVSPQPQKGRISRSWCPSSIRISDEDALQASTNTLTRIPAPSD